MLRINLAIEGLHDPFNMVFGEYIIIGLFFEKTTCINELRVCICFMFRNAQNIYGDGRAKNKFGASEMTVSTKLLPTRY